MRKAVTLFIAASLLASLSFEQVVAQGNLPALPAKAVIDKVIAETGGPDRVPLTIPNEVLDGMNSYAANSVKNAPPQVDPAKASILITQTEVQRIVVPVVGAESMKLAPNTTTVNDGLPAMVIGGSYETSTGLTVLVAVWAKNNDLKPSELRFYADGGARHSTPYKLHTPRLK